MKTPAEYLEAAPVYGSASGPVVTKADAEKAVAAALADAERYKNLLLAALRRTPLLKVVRDDNAA